MKISYNIFFLRQSNYCYIPLESFYYKYIKVGMQVPHDSGVNLFNVLRFIEVVGLSIFIAFFLKFYILAYFNIIQM